MTGRRAIRPARRSPGEPTGCSNARRQLPRASRASRRALRPVVATSRPAPAAPGGRRRPVRSPRRSGRRTATCGSPKADHASAKGPGGDASVSAMPRCAEERRQAEEAPLGSPHLGRRRDDEDPQPARPIGIRLRRFPFIAPQSTTWSTGHRAHSGPCRRGRRPAGTSPARPRPTPTPADAGSGVPADASSGSVARPASRQQARAGDQVGQQEQPGPVRSSAPWSRPSPAGPRGPGARPCNGRADAPTARRPRVRPRAAADAGAVDMMCSAPDTLRVRRSHCDRQ